MITRYKLVITDNCDDGPEKEEGGTLLWLIPVVLICVGIPLAITIHMKRNNKACFKPSSDNTTSQPSRSQTNNNRTSTGFTNNEPGSLSNISNSTGAATNNTAGGSAHYHNAGYTNNTPSEKGQFPGGYTDNSPYPEVTFHQRGLTDNQAGVQPSAPPSTYAPVQPPPYTPY